MKALAPLRNKIRELVKGGSDRILLNMADVTYIDSSAIGELVAAHATIANAGGDIKLLDLAQRVHDLFKITKLYTVFEVFEDEASAIRSFAAAKAARSRGTIPILGGAVNRPHPAVVLVEQRRSRWRPRWGRWRGRIPARGPAVILLHRK